MAINLEIALKCVEYGHIDDLYMIDKWIDSKWLCIASIKKYKKVKEAILNKAEYPYNKHNRYKVLFVKYQNQIKILSFAEEYGSVAKDDGCHFQINDLRCSSISGGVHIYQNNMVIETCIDNQNLPIHRDDIMIYQESKMTLEELINYV